MKTRCLHILPKLRFKIWYVILIPVILSCEKTTIYELSSKKGSLKGRISTYNEFCEQLTDYDSILVKLEGSEPLIASFADNLGVFELKDIKTGTYNLIATKNGFVDYQSRGLQIIGGKEPMYLNIDMIEKSSMILDSLSFSFGGLYEEVTFKISSDKKIPDGQYAHFFIYIHTANNPSNINYLQCESTMEPIDNIGDKITTSFDLNNNLFPSRTKIYVVVYGAWEHFYTTYFSELNKEIYTHFGPPSNIVNIRVP